MGGTIAVMGVIRRSPGNPAGKDPFSAIGDLFVLMVLACLFVAPLALGVYGLNFFFGTEGTGGAIVDGLRQDLVLGIKGV